MSSPLDSTFPTSLTAAPRGNLSCALSDSLQFFMNKENWLFISKANSIQSNYKATRGEERCQKFKVQNSELNENAIKKFIMLNILSEIDRKILPYFHDNLIKSKYLKTR